MIRGLQPGERELPGQEGYWRARLAADLALYAPHPAAGYRFYTLARSGAFLACLPGGLAVLLAGETPAAEEWAELGSFLPFAGLRSLLAPAELPGPPGFSLVGESREFRALGALAVPRPALPCVLQREDDCRAAAALQELEAAERDGFFADACLRRNHGQGRFWLALEGGTAVAAVGVCAVQGGLACLYAGAAKPEKRGRGIGGALIAQAANALLAEGLAPVFTAAPERWPLYQRLGFVQGASWREWAAGP